MSLQPDWPVLIEAAEQVRERAYAPYSGFAVGAALQAGGELFVGCNVENASYPVSLCAERAALAAAVAAGRRAMEGLVVVAKQPLPPCGMCAQALAEFAPSLPLVLVGGGQERRVKLSELCPQPFTLNI